MRVIDLLHRWCGGFVGLILLVMGLSGAILTYKEAWIGLPGASDAPLQSTEALAGTVERLLADPQTRPRSINFASEDFGLNRLSYKRESGAYATQSGEIVARWDSKWDRPEIWIFDLHHHLFTGDTGEKVAGVAALVGLGFVITGVILWWPTRRSFALSVWPAKLDRFSILRHHRNLGVVIAPLLALSLFTGAVMVFRPVAGVVLGPGIDAEVKASFKPPKVHGGKLADHPDWRGMITEARARFPEAEVRILSLPRKKGDAIAIRLRQPAEWLPNGRTTVWFAPDTGKVVGQRDALAASARVKAYDSFYPLHAGAVGGVAWKLATTVTGLALTLLGGFTTWTFWFRRGRRVKASEVLPAAAG
jgi:uncharacterized iron-regulated membrane protein